MLKTIDVYHDADEREVIRIVNDRHFDVIDVTDKCCRIEMDADAANEIKAAFPAFTEWGN